MTVTTRRNKSHVFLASCWLTAGLVLFTSACSTGSKETAVQGALEAGMEACEPMLEDKTIPRTEAAEAFCQRVVDGCYEALP
jgi:hypothetical protein